MRTVLDSAVPDPEDWAELLATHVRHERRLRDVDALVRVAVPGGDSGKPAGTVLTPGAAVLAGGEADVVGLATVRESDQLWVSRRAHALTVRAGGGADLDVGWGSVLDQWLDLVAQDPLADDPETSATVSLASRDQALVAGLVRRHFGPASVLAVRTLERADPDAWTRPPEGVVVRSATLADLPWLLDRTLALHRWETGFGYVPPRPDARTQLEPELAEAIERDQGWTWVAELDGAPVGLCQVNPPESAAWVAGATQLLPVGYLVSAFVDPGLRSAGLGRVLAATAAAAAREAGWAALLLHHAGVSAWSVPFWSSMGYRPLVTSWMRRPAVLPR